MALSPKDLLCRPIHLRKMIRELERKIDEKLELDFDPTNQTEFRYKIRGNVYSNVLSKVKDIYEQKWNVQIIDINDYTYFILRLKS